MQWRCALLRLDIWQGSSYLVAMQRADALLSTPRRAAPLPTRSNHHPRGRVEHAARPPSPPRIVTRGPIRITSPVTHYGGAEATTTMGE
eukprot:scaffold33308_cov31-Tisochrysis_lutea.AAC.1